MSRFAQYDSDSERLPDGMTRVGYDADTQRYQYQDADGSYWEGPPGSQHGRLRRVGDEGESDPFIAAAEEHTLQQGQRESWRYIMPFFLLCAVFLLLLMWWVGRPWGESNPPPPRVVCGGHSSAVIVKTGDTCWSISETYGISLDVLKRENSRIDCDRLQVGQALCVPDE